MLIKGVGLLLLLALASGDEGAAANGDCDREDGLDCDQPAETETARAVREEVGACWNDEASWGWRGGHGNWIGI